MATFQFAADTAANWAATNRTPLLDELCFETDSKRSKLGDGATAYNSLPYLATRRPPFPLPTGALCESFPRSMTAAGTALVSGTPKLTALQFEAGDLVTTLNFIANNTVTAGATPHQWAALCDLSANVLAVSADLTSAVWTAATPKAFAMGTPYRVPTSGTLYAAICQAVTTPVTLLGNSNVNTNLSSATNPPMLACTAPAGFTTPPTVGSNLGALTNILTQPYVFPT